MSDSSRRPTWDETWLAVAEVVAKRSLCVRDQVGSVVVDARNRIVATGYNGPPAGFATTWQGVGRPCSKWCKRAQVSNIDEKYPVAPIALDYSDCPSLHAEANALSVCDRSVRESGTIYITSSVCMGCAKLIANSGLSRVVVSYDDAHLHRRADFSYEFMRSCGIEVLLA